MNAIVNTGPGQLAWREMPLPEPGPGQVRVRTAACAICATDLAMIDGWERTGFPAVPGHEWSGTVDAAGPGVDGALVGRFCVADNFLADGGEVGFEHPGGYGETFLTEAGNLYPLPAGFLPAVATLIEPLAVSVRAVRRLRREDCTRALVLGDGPIGLIILMLLRRAGAGELVVVGGREGRLAIARELGAAKTLNYHRLEGDLAVAVDRACGVRFPTVVEASGSTSAARAALDLVAPRGRVLIVGDYGEARADFPWNHVLQQEIELVGSNSGTGAWPEAVQLATGDALPLCSLVTHTFPAHRFTEAMALARGHRDDVIKVVLEWSAA